MISPSVEIRVTQELFHILRFLTYEDTAENDTNIIYLTFLRVPISCDGFYPDEIILRFFVLIHQHVVQQCLNPEEMACLVQDTRPLFDGLGQSRRTAEAVHRSRPQKHPP